MKKLITPIFILLLAASIYPCAPTQVLGRVVQPLFGFRAVMSMGVAHAVVTLVNLNTGARQITQSNVFGYFSVNLPCGSYRATATSRMIKLIPVEFVLSGEQTFGFTISTGEVEETTRGGK